MRYIRFKGDREENLFGQGTKISHLLKPNVVTPVDDDDAEGWVRGGLAVYSETEQDLATIGEDAKSIEKAALKDMKRDELLAELNAKGFTESDVEGTGAKGHVTNEDLRSFLLNLDDEQLDDDDE